MSQRELSSQSHLPQESQLPRRAVLLGASNLTRGISTVLEAVGCAWGQPLEVLAALGHGRSYGMNSRVLIRTLPGIMQCGLWKELARRGPLPTAALVTDIGNDLLFEVSVDTLALWVETVLDRLEQHESQITMTLLPERNMDHLSPARFHFFRRLFVPGCSLTLDELRQRVDQLNDRLRQMSAARNVNLVEQDPRWYGLDPIHFHSQHWEQAWSTIASHWKRPNDMQREDIQRPPLFRWLYLRRLVPDERWVLGRRQSQPQPAGRLDDGSTISLY